MAVHRTETVRFARGRSPTGGATCAGEVVTVPVSVVAVAEFDSPVREQIAALKYGRDRRIAASLGDRVADLVPADVEVVSWIPTAPSRVRERGFDQSELVARRAARRAARRCRRLLRRLDDTRQTGGDSTARRAGPRLVASPACRGRSVVLVDDVVTTGATVRAASAAVLAAGAARVVCLCVATVPRR